jgi:hypothetical protein
LGPQQPTVIFALATDVLVVDVYRLGLFNDNKFYKKIFLSTVDWNQNWTDMKI